MSMECVYVGVWSTVSRRMGGLGNEMKFYSCIRKRKLMKMDRCKDIVLYHALFFKIKHIITKQKSTTLDEYNQFFFSPFGSSRHQFPYLLLVPLQCWFQYQTESKNPQFQPQHFL